VIHHDSYLAKKTLKDQLQDTLKKLKIKTSNEEGLERATLQYDQVLLCTGPIMQLEHTL